MKSKNIFLLVISLLVGTNLVIAEPVTNSTISAADQIMALKKQVDDAYAAYTATNDASGKLWDTYYHLNDTNLPVIFELAKEAPASISSFEAFAWIVTNGRISVRSLRPFGNQSLEFLRDYHTTNSGIGEICRHLGERWDSMDETAIEFLRIASKKNPDRNARGYATFALGQMLKGRAEALAFFPFSPPLTNQWWLQANAAYQEEVKKSGANTLFARAQQRFETVMAQYADCPIQTRHGLRNPKATLGKEAKVELYELNYLEPGKMVPEISGGDLDGKHLKLSRYRGDVVVLSFWASWCGPCMQMIPLERALAERLKNQPFTMLGVNGDGSTADAKRAMQKEGVTWPSFWNQGGPNGAIADTWNIHGWPTVFVIDPNGVIRLKFEGYGGDYTSNLLNAAVDRLLNESPGRKK
jgi:thiol-disulfide isomerase/thioredoxin